MTHLRLTERGTTIFEHPPCGQLKFRRMIDRKDCLVCNGGSFVAVARDRINPELLVVSPDRYAKPIPEVVDTELVDALRDDDAIFVMASDERAWTTGLIRGAVISASTAAMRFALASGPNGEIRMGFTRTPGVAAAAATAKHASRRGAFVAAMSGRRQEVAFVERDDAGDVKQRVRFVDFDLRDEITKNILGDHQLHDPVAMTYRAEDDAYYVLDRSKPSRTKGTLYRLPRGMTLEIVGIWHAPFAESGVAMTTGSDGLLVITSWDERRHAIAVVDPDAQRRDRGRSRALRHVTLRIGDGAVEVPAHRNLDGITLVVRDRSGLAKAVRLSHFDTKQSASRDDRDDDEQDDDDDDDDRGSGKKLRGKKERD